MTASGKCVPADRLRDHLRGELADADEAGVIAHLDTCSDCQNTIEELAGGERLLHTAREMGGAAQPEDDAVLRVLCSLKRLDPLAASSVPTADETLDLLDPPRDAAHLGRLAHYEVIEIVGQGGMGVVLKAIDEKLDRVVCLKLVSGAIVGHSTRQRFLREAQAAAAVRGDHVVTIFAVEEHRGYPFLAMEYVAGHSLQDELDRCGPLPLEELVRVGLETAQGLAAAHSQGLVHRDIKPANILLEEGSGRVKITDFGLARAIDDSSISREGVITGTPEYMSPEQARGEPVDHRTDLFSLGSVLYAMCTGCVPFQAANTPAVLARVSNEAPPPIREVKAGVPAWLIDLIAKLHAKDPAQRVGSAAEVAEMLARRQAVLPQPAATVAGSRDATGRRTVRFWPLGLMAVVLAGLSVGAYIGAPLAMLWLTNQGRIEFITDHPDLQVLISQRGHDPRTVNPSADGIIRLDAGEYHLQLASARGDLRLMPGSVNLAAGGIAQVAIRAETGFVGQLRSLETTHQIVAVSVSADGRLVAAGTAGRLMESGPVWELDSPVVLWDLESGKELRRLTGHENSVRGVAFSRDGKRVFSASNDQTIRTWNVESGVQSSSLGAGASGLIGMSFSADGLRLLGGGGDQIVRLWDLRTGDIMWRCKEHAEPVASMALSFNGRRCITGGEGRWDEELEKWRPGSDHSLRQWDLATGQELWRLTGHTDFVSRVVYSPDGRHAVSSSHDNTVRLWDVETGDQLQCLTGHRWTVKGVAISADGKRAISAGGDATVRVWDLERGEELYCFEGHRGGVRCVSFCPGDRWAVSGGDDGTVRLWQLPDR